MEGYYGEEPMGEVATGEVVDYDSAAEFEYSSGAINYD